MNKEMNMQVEIDKLEWEVKRQQDIGLVLADRLNEKIDECEDLKSEVARLNNLIMSMPIGEK
jgi:hypothetical protein